jgi:hypothetical protein
MSMTGSSWKGRSDAQCPFFSADVPKTKRIICEGIVDRSTLTLYFQRKKDYDIQLSVFCCEHYKNCELYRAIMSAKYDEED